MHLKFYDPAHAVNVESGAHLQTARNRVVLGFGALNEGLAKKEGAEFQCPPTLIALRDQEIQPTPQSAQDRGPRSPRRASTDRETSQVNKENGGPPGKAGGHVPDSHAALPRQVPGEGRSCQC
jgi:hypothetical protein